jgi:CheY-like chemotaxis protein
MAPFAPRASEPFTCALEGATARRRLIRHGGEARRTGRGTMTAVAIEAARVLVVDDDASIREFLRELLISNGYEVDEASNGAEALECIQSRRPDAVLMDLMMPVVSGAEATSRIKQNPLTATIPVVAMSAGRNLQSMANGVPADGFVSKPFDLARLLAEIERLTGHFA